MHMTRWSDGFPVLRNWNLYLKGTFRRDSFKTKCSLEKAGVFWVWLCWCVGPGHSGDTKQLGVCP